MVDLVVLCPGYADLATLRDVTTGSGGVLMHYTDMEHAESLPQVMT